MDVAFLTIAELNRLYYRRELSPVDVTRASIDRIASHDGKLHSFLLVTEEGALEEARAAERELMAGARRGPLHGVPYALRTSSRPPASAPPGIRNCATTMSPPATPRSLRGSRRAAAC